MPQISKDLAFGIITDNSTHSAWDCAKVLTVKIESFGDVSVPAYVDCRGWIDTTEVSQ
jgi:hypothetical protein